VFYPVDQVRRQSIDVNFETQTQRCSRAQTRTDTAKLRSLDSLVQLVVLDSVNGFMNAMPAERLLGVQLHELLTFLANKGVSIIMTLVQRGVFGAPVDEAAEVSYLADTVILLRYFEAFGEGRKAISLVKRRSGSHANTVRELLVDANGMQVGREIKEFQGVLSGRLQYSGAAGPLLPQGQAAEEAEIA